MRHEAPTRRTVLTAALAAVATTASLTAGCTRHGTADDGRPPQATPTPGEGTPAPSGQRATGSVLAVKIDNVAAARPQTGLDSADVVYAEQVEGGLSRLMAVYATGLPAVIGPVRSVRESDLELLRQFDRPTLAFSGAQRKLLPLIGRAPLRPESPAETSRAYYRGSGRPAPHNLYLRPAAVLPDGAPGRAALTTGFRYGPAPAGGMATAARTVRYPAARFTFTWSGDHNRWLVSMDGTPARTTAGTRLTAPTVVVQYVKVTRSGFHDVLGNYTPYTHTVGSGRADVLRDGRTFRTTWSRPAATDGTAFTGADGAPVDFADGPVWVVFVKA
ncbi:MAG: DUF3048 domain-containing protein [Streptomyces sp.]|uniref:DUF3048 domain-containing protein n=1 Tax=Streptomyces sp. TaxID=1931 RepID=UPI0025F30A7E|nr:DUF3048 domain-containing protein [Streptomyces sp.]MBW8793943.1 DUF3048 domain-containing protein [Streptomyces sp.]